MWTTTGASRWETEPDGAGAPHSGRETGSLWPVETELTPYRFDVIQNIDDEKDFPPGGHRLHSDHAVPYIEHEGKTGKNWNGRLPPP